MYKPYPVINSESRTDANPALFPRNWYKPIRNNDSQETKITGHTKKLFCVRSWRFCLNCQFLRARGTKPNRDVLTPDNEQKHSIYHGRKKSKLIWRKLSAIQLLRILTQTKTIFLAQLTTQKSHAVKTNDKSRWVGDNYGNFFLSMTDFSRCCWGLTGNCWKERHVLTGTSWSACPNYLSNGGWATERYASSSQFFTPQEK